jgi:hypothetical protein
MHRGEVMRYRLYGLEVASDLPLDGAAPGDPELPADVRIVREPDLPVTHAPADAILREGEGVVFSVAGVARYRIIGGARIDVAIGAGADPHAVALFLTGTAIGLLLQQRGLLVLHANALVRDGRALAVLGPSGAGKSTLAARLVQAGFALLADDVVAVRTGSDGDAPRALPGFARMRLWGEAASALGIDAATLAPVRAQVDKYVVPAARPARVAVPLAAVYILERADALAETGFARLRGTEAVAALMANSYRGQYLALTGGERHHFGDCVALARSVPVHRWSRRWGHDEGAAQTDSLIAHFATLKRPDPG